MRYFDQYVSLIDSGKIIVCEMVALQIERVKRFKEKYIFKQEEADKRINYIESHCSNTKGSSGLLKLALPQKVWLEVSWGFYKEVKITKTNPDTMEQYDEIVERRLTNETALVIARGTGKTTIGAAIGKVGQLIDGEYGADIQMLAYTREQAGYLYNASTAMNNNKDSILFKLKKQNILRSTKIGELYRPTNSLMTIKTSDYEVLDGTNAHYNIFDEIHTYDEDFIKVVNDGSSRKRNNWMSWYITTNGIKRDRVFDKYYAFWEKILKGEIENDAIQIWIYKLDDVNEIYDPSKWQKAMPLLGITTMPETIQLDIEMSKDDPVKQAELMAKTFNLPINNYLSYFSNEECQGNKELFDEKLFIGTPEKNAYCGIGLDLSDVNDICSAAFIIPVGDIFYFLTRNYLPRKSLEKVKLSRRKQYEEWEALGELILHEHDYNDKKVIFDDLLEFMQNNYILPVIVGYDKWGADEIVRYFEQYYGNICVEIQQNVKTLSQPLKIYKSKLKHGKIIFKNQVSTWNHGNVKVKIDANKNIYPNKAKSIEKIDIFMAQLIAYTAYSQNSEKLQFYYSDYENIQNEG